MKIMRGGEKLMSRAEEEKWLGPMDREWLIKLSIKFVAMRLIKDRYGIIKRPGIDILQEVIQSEHKYQLPYIFDSARRLVRKEKPLPYMEWVWWDKRRMARGDVDAHNSRRWKAQIEAMYRYFPEFRPKS